MLRFSRLVMLALGAALVASSVPANAQHAPLQGAGAGHDVIVNDPLLAPMPAAPKSVNSWAEAVALLRARSTDLKIAYDEVTRAEAKSRVALAGTLPSVNASGDITHNITNATVSGGTGNIDPTTGGIDPNATKVLEPTYLEGDVVAIQPLFAPRVWHQMETAGHAEDVAKLDVETRKRRLTLALASALVVVVAAERISELNRSGLRVALERFQLAVDRKTIGGGTQLDVLRAKNDVDSARKALITGDESLRQAREALGLAVGIPGEVGVSPSISLDALEQGARGACKTTSIEGRADLAAARGRLDLAQSSVTDVKWQFSPTIDARSTIYGVSYGALPNPIWNVQAVLTLPIWDGGARYGMLRAANVDADEAEQNLVAVRRDVTVEVEQAIRGVKVATAQRQVDVEARETAAETDELTQLAFRTGQGTSLELVTAAAQLRQAEINLALGDFELVRARVAELLSRSNCSW
jgi:outer membrane protein TolC